MKTTAVILGSLTFIALALSPAQAGYGYYEGIQTNTRSQQFGTRTMNGYVPRNARDHGAPVIMETVPGRGIEFSRDKDGRWWPSRSISR